MSRLINDTLGHLALVIPLAALIIVLREEVVRILFQRGNFDAASTALTSQVLGWLLLGAYGFAAQTVVVRGFYALKNTLFPAIFTTLAVAASLPLYWLGLKHYGAAGIAMAIALSATIQVLLLYEVWNRRHRLSGRGVVFRQIAIMIGLSSPLALFLAAFKTYALAGISPASFSGSLIRCIIVGGVFTVCMLAAGYGLNIVSIREVIARRRPPRSSAGH